jgi:hypothetical protein
MTELNVKFTVVIKSGNAFPTNLIHTTYVFCSKPMMLILQCVSFSLERKKNAHWFQHDKTLLSASKTDISEEKCCVFTLFQNRGFQKSRYFYVQHTFLHVQENH